MFWNPDADYTEGEWEFLNQELPDEAFGEIPDSVPLVDHAKPEKITVILTDDKNDQPDVTFRINGNFAEIITSEHHHVRRTKTTREAARGMYQKCLLKGYTRW